MHAPQLCTAGVAVAAGAPGELPVVAARRLLLARQHMQAARRAGARIEFDVGAAAGHAGGHRDLPGAAGGGDDGGLVGVVQGVEHGVPDTARVEQPRQGQRVADAVAAHQHRPAGSAELCRARRHGLEQRRRPREVPRRQGAAPARLVPRHAHHGAAVDGAQLGPRLPQRAADAAQAPVALEEALEGGLRDGLGFGRRAQAFLQGHHGVQATRPDPPRRHAAGHFVEQLDGAGLDEVVHVAAVEVQCGQCQQHGLAPVARPQPGPAQSGGLRGELLLSLRAELRRAVGVLQREVLTRHQRSRQRQRLPQEGAAGRVRRRARQDQWHLGLVEQDAVGLVEQRPAQAAHQRRQRGAPAQRVCGLLDVAAAGELLVVAQEVEGQVLGGGVDDITGVDGATLGVGLAGLQRTGLQAQRGEEGHETGGVAAGQVRVGGDHVHRHAGQCRHGRGQRNGQGLALAGGHLGHVVGQQRGGGDVLRRPCRPAQGLGGDGRGGTQRLRHDGRLQAVVPQSAAQRVQRRRALRQRQLCEGFGVGRGAARQRTALRCRAAPGRAAPGRGPVVLGPHRASAPQGTGHRQHPRQFEHGGAVHERPQNCALKRCCTWRCSARRSCMASGE